MAAIVNDRDKSLQHGGPRITVTSVNIQGTATAIVNKKNGAGYQPVSITLTLLTTGFPNDGAQATFTWEYSLSSSPDTWVSMGTGTSQVITAVTIAGFFPNASLGSVRYRVTGVQTGYQQSKSPTYTITYTKESDDASAPTISPVSVVVNTNSDGTVLTPNPAPYSGVAIGVKLGSVDMPYAASGPSTYSVSVSAPGLTLGAETSTSYFYTRADITGMSTDTATATYTVSVRNASNVVVSTHSLLQSFVKKKASAVSAGSEPYTHDLTPSILVLPTDDSGTVTSYANANAKYTVKQGAVDKTTTWTLSKNEYNALSTLTTDGNLHVYGMTGPSHEVSRSPATAYSSGGWSGPWYYNGYVYATGYIGGGTSNKLYRRQIKDNTSAWEELTLPQTYRYVYSIFYSSITNSLFATVQRSDGTFAIYGSATGSTWSLIKVDNTPIMYIFQIPGDNSYIYADTSTFNFTIYRSSNGGASWGAVGSSAGRIINIFGNGLCVAAYGSDIWVNNSPSTMATSSWTSTTLPGNARPLSIAFYNGAFYTAALLSSGAYFYKSYNGIAWTQVSKITAIDYSGFDGAVIQIFNGAFYFTVNISNITIYKSTDGVSWLKMVPPVVSAGSPSPGNRWFKLMCLPLSTDGSYFTLSDSSLIYTPIYAQFLADSPADALRQYHMNISSVSDITEGYVDITATKPPDVQVTKRVTIKKGSKVNPVVVTGVTPSQVILQADSTGKVTNYANATNIKITVMENGVDATSSWSITNISSSVSMSYSGTYPTYTLTSVPDASDTGTTTFSLSKVGFSSQTCEFSYIKNKGQIPPQVNAINKFSTLTSTTGYVAVQWNADGWVKAKYSAGGAYTNIIPWATSTTPVPSVEAAYYLKIISTGALSGPPGYVQLSTSPVWILDNSGGATPSSISSTLKMYVSTAGNDATVLSNMSEATITASK